MAVKAEKCRECKRDPLMWSGVLFGANFMLKCGGCGRFEIACNRGTVKRMWNLAMRSQKRFDELSVPKGWRELWRLR